MSIPSHLINRVLSIYSKKLQNERPSSSGNESGSYIKNRCDATSQSTGEKATMNELDDHIQNEVKMRKVKKR